MHSSGRGNENGQSKTEKKNVVYHPEALQELIEAAEYYESCSQETGILEIKR